MPTDTERTIFKLELDGSAYIEGADKLSASTSKLSAAQEKANAKLAELQKTHNAYKKSLEEVDAVLKSNEKETIELTKQLNSLKDSQKGTTAEASKLKAALRDIAVNTKEFRAEAKELGNNISATTKQINIQTKEIEAGVKANGNFAGSLGKAFSGLRSLANLIPGIGIGGLVALISGPLIDALKAWIFADDEVAKRQKLITEISDNAIKSYTGQVVHLGLIKDKLDDLNIPQKERIALAKDYNKTAEEGNRIDLKQIDNIDLLNAAIDRQIKKLEERAFAKAAENVITEKAEKLFIAQSDLEINFPIQSDKRIKEITARAEAALLDGQKRLGIAGKLNVKELLSFADLPEDQIKELANKNKRFAVLLDERVSNVLRTAQRELKFIQDYRSGAKAGGAGVSIQQAVVDQARKDLEDALEAAKGFITIEGLFSDKSHAATTKIANIYEQELQKLKADIAKLDEKGFTDEATIKKAVEEDFKKRSLAFAEAQKKGQLTPSELTSLNQYLSELQTLTLAQNLKSFREQKAAYLAQIQNELDNLQLEEAGKRISTIRDKFERERAMIIAETEKTLNILRDKRDKLITDISKNAAKNGLTPADIAPQILSIKNTYSKLLDDIEIIKNQKLQQLSFDTFEKLSEDAKRLLDSGNLGISQGSLINIKEQTALFLAGKISYKQYQKQLTEIAKFEAGERFRIDKLFLESEIKIRKDKLASDKSLTSEQTTRLEDEIRRLQQQLADAEKGNVIGKGVKPQDNERLKKLLSYANAIGAVADSVIQFWQTANKVEEAALDRSISLQEKRVNAAQRIAERGNAQYLKAEEDRLRELQVKRENAARKQLGIDAALQASQILVGITGAIAKIATPGIGIAETIGAIAIIVGALATGYGLVKSLQGNQPTFFKGTKDTGRGGREDGKGGFTATLHPNEAVIPSEQNKAYSHAVAAIYDQTIPAEHLNQFVKTYHKIKSVPMPDYSRIRDAAELKIGQDGRMSVLLSEHSNLLKENNELQKAILKKKGVHAELNVDKNGVAMMVTEYLEQMEINKKL